MRAHDRRKAWRPSPLRPSRVFFSRALNKTDQKTYLAPAMQAIQRATKIFILNTYIVVTKVLAVQFIGS